MFWRSSERDGVVLLAVALQRLLARLDLLALLGQLLPEPVGRLLRRQELELEVLLDVRLRERVGDRRRQRGSGELNFTSTSRLLRIGRHRQAFQEPVDRDRTASSSPPPWAAPPASRPRTTRHHRRSARLSGSAQPRARPRVEPRMVPELQRVERPPGQRAALQDLVLRLVVVVGDLVLLEGFLEVDDVRAFLLDQDLHPRLVDRRRGERVDGDRHDDDAGTRSARSSAACAAP